ncbi:hypothetical protein LPPLD21_02451 [Lactiplantibacillus paraplantarum]|uniref:Uncharacterized protein n=1 Tax=Lactiplantibacillus paraplantarum TaxID=60520 RepID=A0ABQ0NCY4_9LACO|nr:hypothetical protein LPPLD21_02451 [Lactiplantibacillus paraplantarum]
MGGVFNEIVQQSAVQSFFVKYHLVNYYRANLVSS